MPRYLMTRTNVLAAKPWSVAPIVQTLRTTTIMFCLMSFAQRGLLFADNLEGPCTVVDP